jgi:hypothetical protein
VFKQGVGRFINIQGLKIIMIDKQFPLIDSSLPEINDDPQREAIHPLYAERKIDFERQHGEGLRAYEQLSRHYGSHTKN